MTIHKVAHSRLCCLPSPVLYTQVKQLTTLMRICLSAIVILLGANLLVDLLDSDMVSIMKERNETIQRTIEGM